MFEQASDHHCAIRKSLVQRTIILRSVPTLSAKITWQWCQEARVFDADVSISLAALLLFAESVMAYGGGQEHKWALCNVICRVDADLAVKTFEAVDTAKYCCEVKVRRHYASRLALTQTSAPCAQTFHLVTGSDHFCALPSIATLTTGLAICHAAASTVHCCSSSLHT
jgi:hypothetical protein